MIVHLLDEQNYFDYQHCLYSLDKQGIRHTSLIKMTLNLSVSYLGIAHRTCHGTIQK